MRVLRRKLPREFPGTQFFFQPADIVGQILNFGLPSPIDVQMIGADLQTNLEIANRWWTVSARFPEPRTCTFSRL